MVRSTSDDSSSRKGPPTKRARISPSTPENDIPSSSHYQLSYAHRAVVTCICYSVKHDIVLTASQDGVVKFWKRTSVSSSLLQNSKSITENKGSAKGGGGGNSDVSSTGLCLEFIKSYMAHTEAIQALVTSLLEGDAAASIGEDNVIKFYDVGGFDVTGMIQVNDMYQCGAAAAFIGEDQSLLAVSSMSRKGKERTTNGMSSSRPGTIYIFSSLTLSPVPVKEINLHAAPLTAMSYNYQHHCMISADEVSRVPFMPMHHSLHQFYIWIKMRQK